MSKIIHVTYTATIKADIPIEIPDDDYATMSKEQIEHYAKSEAEWKVDQELFAYVQDYMYTGGSEYETENDTYEIEEEN